MNIKSSFFYAALAVCFGTGYAAHSLVAPDHVPVELRYADCADNSGKPTLDKTPRPLSRGEGF